jgi:hypothetical protein
LSAIVVEHHPALDSPLDRRALVTGQVHPGGEMRLLVFRRLGRPIFAGPRQLDIILVLRTALAIQRPGHHRLGDLFAFGVLARLFVLHDA